MKEFKRFSIVSILAVVFVLFTMGSASADNLFGLSLASDGNNVLVWDNQTGDSNATVGAITFIGPIGTWNVNVSTGVTMPVIGSIIDPQLDLNTVNIGVGSLTIGVTSYGFSAPFPVGLGLSVGGTLNGVTDTAQFDAYYDDVMDSFWTGYGAVITSPTFTGPGSFSGDYSGTAIQLYDGNDNLMGLTLYANLYNDALGNTSFDAHLKAVPEPVTMLLLGLGLVGLAGVRRFKK